MWKVNVKKKVAKNFKKLPAGVLESFKVLVCELQESGPVQVNWPNYSKLGKGKYHCHLNYRYVACWTADKETITIEVYYVGSRESSPY